MGHQFDVISIIRVWFRDLIDNQPKRSPISISSSSSLGGGGGAYFFFYYFLASTLVYAGAGALEADDPPKLKKEEISFPWSALAKTLAQ